VVAIKFLPFEISHQSSPGWRGHCWWTFTHKRTTDERSIWLTKNVTVQRQRYCQLQKFILRNPLVVPSIKNTGVFFHSTKVTRDLETTQGCYCHLQYDFALVLIINRKLTTTVLQTEYAKLTAIGPKVAVAAVYGTANTALYVNAAVNTPLKSSGHNIILLFVKYNVVTFSVIIQLACEL